jgi:hypothetical protein
VRVSTVENTKARVLSYRVTVGGHVAVHTSNNFLSSEMTRMLRTVRGSIRTVLLTAEDLGLLLWDEGSTTVDLLLPTLLHMSDDVLLLLELCCFHLIPVQALHVLKALF